MSFKTRLVIVCEEKADLEDRKETAYFGQAKHHIRWEAHITIVGIAKSKVDLRLIRMDIVGQAETFIQEGPIS